MDLYQVLILSRNSYNQLAPCGQSRLLSGRSPVLWSACLVLALPFLLQHTSPPQLPCSIVVSAVLPKLLLELALLSRRRLHEMFLGIQSRSRSGIIVCAVLVLVLVLLQFLITGQARTAIAVEPTWVGRVRRGCSAPQTSKAHIL